MEITFIGTGEAFDEDRINTSILIKDKINILLDCGYQVPPALIKHIDIKTIDAIYISHFHGDHTLGIPPLLLRMWEEKRTKPLYLIGQKGLLTYFNALMSLSYKSFLKRFNFPITIMEVEEEKEYEFLGFKLSFMETNHSTKNLAIKIEGDEISIAYSGDGDIPQGAREFYRDLNILIHEGFSFKEKIDGHSNIEEVVSLVGESNIKSCYILHIGRIYHREKENEIKDFINKNAKNIFLPKDGDKIEI